MRSFIAVMLGVTMVMSLAAPAVASTPLGEAGIFDQLWQWISQISQYVWQIENLYQNLMGQILSTVYAHLGSTDLAAYIQQLEGILNSLGQLSGPLAWVYQGAIRDIGNMLGVGEEVRPYSTPWFVKNNPATREAAERTVETAVKVASGTARSQTAASTSANVAAQISASQDVVTSTSQTYGAASQLAGQATNIPSSRAGIQMLIAGQSAMMRAQADALGSMASRLNALSQQQAATSQQLDAMNETIGQMARNQQQQMEREEKDKQAILNMTVDAADKSINTAMTYMSSGIIGEGRSSGGESLLAVRRKRR